MKKLNAQSHVKLYKLLKTGSFTTKPPVKDAEWALQELEKHLPLSNEYPCECSADIVYYIAQIRKELKRGKK